MVLRLGIGFVTCGRIAFTRQVIESLWKYNPVVKRYHWIVADDNSEPCMRNYFNSLGLDMTYLWHDERKGINSNLKQMFDEARGRFDLLLIFVNDFICLREIDIGGIIEFFQKTPEAGQVQMFHWKGKLGDKKRERSMTNWITGEPIKMTTDSIQAGSETLIEANWVWTDGVNFTRILPDVDYFEGALGLPKEEKYIKVAEITKGKNFMNTGMKIYEMTGQPFLHLDHDGKNKTKGTIA